MSSFMREAGAAVVLITLTLSLQCAGMAALISFAKPSLAPDDPRLLVQAFVSEFPIEALDVRVLCRFPWFDEVKFHTVFVGPLVHHAANELRAVIYDDFGGHPAFLFESF